MREQAWLREQALIANGGLMHPVEVNVQLGGSHAEELGWVEPEIFPIEAQDFQVLRSTIQNQSFSDIGFSVKQYHQVLINSHDQNHVMDANNLIIQLTINYLETKINTLISRITHDSDNQQRLTLNSLIHEKNSLKRQLKLNLQQGT